MPAVGIITNLNICKLMQLRLELFGYSSFSCIIVVVGCLLKAAALAAVQASPQSYCVLPAVRAAV